MALWQWSTTPASNANVGNIDMATGSAPSTVHPSVRQLMADVATWYQTPEWLNFGITPSYISATQFTAVGDQTAIYTVGRRVRTFNTAGTVYGTITASVYTSLTTVTVKLDGGGAMDSGLSEVDVGLLNPAFTSLPTGLSPAVDTLTATDGIHITANGISLASQGLFAVWNEVSGSGATSLVNNQGIGGGGFIFRNINETNTSETGRVTFDGSGNVLAGGTVSAQGSPCWTAATFNPTAYQAKGNYAISTTPNVINLSWNGTELNLTIDSYSQGYLWNSGNFNPSTYATLSYVNGRAFYSTDGRMEPGWTVGSGYVAVIVDSTAYSITLNPSDERLKENIEPAQENALDVIGAIKLYSFNYRPTTKNFLDPAVRHPVGFLAQQLQQINPTFVSGDSGDTGPMMSPNLLPIVAHLVKAVQELRAELLATRALLPSN